MSLLTLIQDAADVLGLPRPSSASDGSAGTRQLVGLSRRGGKEIARRHDWRSLIIPGQIVGDGVSTGFDLPADFDRLVEGDPVFNPNALTTPAAGGLNSGDWIRVSNSLGLGTVKAFRLLGGQLHVFPVLAVGEVMPLEYVSANWVLSADATTRRPRWSQDSDYSAIPEDLLELDLIWRWRKAKGLAWESENDEFEDALGRAAFADRARRSIAVGSSADDDELATPAFPDTIPVA